MEALAAGRSLLEGLNVTPRQAITAGLQVKDDGRRRSAFALLSFPEITLADLGGIFPELTSLDPEISGQLAKDALYANYIERQERDVAGMKRDENWVIPDAFDYTVLPGLSNELKLKLGRARPQTLGQAARVDGVTPAALTLILAKLRQQKREMIA